MKKWLFLLLLFPLTCVAQTYQYLGVEDGLSNRRVYYIQKDNVVYVTDINAVLLITEADHNILEKFLLNFTLISGF